MSRCVIVFFTSLAGVGYVAPEEIARTVEFLPGTPVFDLAGRQALERRMQEQKALENEWAKKKRPKDVSHIVWPRPLGDMILIPSREHGCNGLVMTGQSGDGLHMLFSLVLRLQHRQS